MKKSLAGTTVQLFLINFLPVGFGFAAFQRELVQTISEAVSISNEIAEFKTCGQIANKSKHKLDFPQKNCILDTLS